MVEVRLRAVRVDLQSNTPVLLLQEMEGEGRTLPIYIGTQEATAIAYALQGVAMPRPMTHDLIKDLLGALDVDVERVVITELRSSTYYAELQLRNGTTHTVVSSRPSDAVAVAVRTGCRLYVSDELMDSEAILLALDADIDVEDEEGGNPEELRFVCSEASRGVQKLMDFASAVIHGSSKILDQSEIDGFLAH